MDELQATRDLILKEREKVRPVIEAIRVFLGNANALKTHSATCHICRIQEPTMFTCPLGHAIKITTNTYLTLMENNLKEFDSGALNFSENKINGSSVTEDRRSDGAGTQA